MCKGTRHTSRETWGRTLRGNSQDWGHRQESSVEIQSHPSSQGRAAEAPRKTGRRGLPGGGAVWLSRPGMEGASLNPMEKDLRPVGPPTTCRTPAFCAPPGLCRPIVQCVGNDRELSFPGPEWHLAAAALPQSLRMEAMRYPGLAPLPA